MDGQQLGHICAHFRAKSLRSGFRRVSASVPAALTEAEKFQCVEDHVEIFCCRSFHAQAIDRAVLKTFGLAAVHTGEVVMIPLHRRIESFSRR